MWGRALRGGTERRSPPPVMMRQGSPRRHWTTGDYLETDPIDPMRKLVAAATRPMHELGLRHGVVLLVAVEGMDDARWWCALKKRRRGSGVARRGARAACFAPRWRTRTRLTMQ
eukprot:gene6897-291_t